MRGHECLQRRIFVLGPDGTKQPYDTVGLQPMLELVYQDVDQVLWWAAELSVRAQLAYLRGE